MINFSVLLKPILFVLVLLPVYCARNQIQAIDSIEGFWQVTEIRSHYGQYAGGPLSIENTVLDTGIIGSFSFERDNVEYNFTRNDTVYQGISPWKLNHRKVQNSFFLVSEFTLEIGEEFLFNVTFEDGTRNAERGARSMTIVDDSIATSVNSAVIELELLKE